jgi:haloalkane dehalogenase
MAAVGDDFSCFAPDLPGLGECEEPPSSFDYSRAALSGFLDGLLAALGIKGRIVLVVHDIGGVMGVPWAAEHLDRIRGVVITNSVVFEKFPWFGVARIWAREGAFGRMQAALRMQLIGLSGGALFRRVFGRISPELQPQDLERMTREFALNPVARRSTLRLFRRMVPHAFFDGVDAMVARMIARVPTRVVWGRGDPYIPERYADAFPGAPPKLLERAGHWVPISSPEEVAAAIRAVAGDGKEERK